MSNPDGRTAIALAIIGLIGTITTAIIGNWDKIFNPSPTTPPTTSPTTPPTTSPTTPPTTSPTTPPTTSPTTPPTTFPTTSPTTPPTTENRKPSPSETINNYYKAINNGQYRQAWDMLTIDLQENKRVHPDGYNSFKNWLNQITPIIVNDLKTIKESQFDSEVFVRYKTSSSHQSIPLELVYQLTWNEMQEKWVIESVRKIN